MLIRSISIEGFTCFAEKLTLNGFSDKINVLYGPNGIGKSSIFRALQFALFRRYNATGALIESVLPWDRQLTPNIALEFQHAGQEYRLAKRFIYARSAHIDRREGGRWTPFAETDQAERFLEGMTGRTLGRTGSREFAGFAEVLWTSQGDLQLPSLSDDVISAIQKSVGAHVSASVQGLKRKIKEDYGKVFTPNTGKLKSGKDACLQQRLQDECGRLESAVKEADALVHTYEAAATMITTLQESVDTGEARKIDFEQQVEQLRSQRDRYRETKSALENKQAERSLAEAKLRRISDCIQTVQRCRKEETDLRARIEKLSADQKTQQLALERVQEQLRKAQHRQAECESVQEAAQEAAAAAEEAERYLSAIRERAELESRKTRIDKAKAELSKAREQVMEILAPTHGELAELRKHQSQTSSLKSRLESARISLTFTAECAISINVHAGELPAPQLVAAGQTIVMTGAPNLSFSVPELGRFDISGPVTDYAEVVKDYDAELAWLRQFAKRFGTSDLPELEKKRDKVNELESHISSAETRIQTLLESTSENAMDSRLAKLISLINTFGQRHPDWSANTPDAAGLRTIAATQGRTAKVQLEQARSATVVAMQNYQAALRDLDRTENNIKNTNGGIELAGQRLSEALRDGLSDEQRENNRLRTAAAVITYGEQVKELEKKLSAFPKNLEEELAALERTLKDLVARLGNDRDSLIAAKAQLSVIAQESPYLTLSTAKECLSTTKRELAEEKRRNEATSLLYDTLNKVTEESLSAVAEPVANRASQHLESVCGKPLARIRLGNSFQSVEVIPNNCGEQGKQVDCMSGGEREQIYLCTRLALAEELAHQERQLVILDDVLTVTDANRMARICDLLECSAQRLQIVLLTCQPERFHRLQKSNFIDLLEVIKRQREATDIA